MPVAVPAVAVPGGPDLRLTLLDGFDVHRDAEPVEVSPGAQRLLALLALQRRPMTRVQVAATLWPETPDDRAQSSLRSTLWRLAKGTGPLVAAAGRHLRLSTSVTSDYPDAVQHASRLLRGELDQPWETVAHELDSELLPGWSDEWVTVEQERFRQLRLHALEALADQLTSCGRYGLAVEAGLAAVSAEPLRESAHRSVIVAHLAEGNRTEAVRQYEQCRARLRTELGVVPSTGLRQLLAEPRRPERQTRPTAAARQPRAVPAGMSPRTARSA